MGSFRAKWFGWSAGLSADADLQNLTLMVGPTIALRTLPFADSLHLNLGLAYGPRKRLAAEYRVLAKDATISSETAESTLTQSTRDIGAYIGISFRFAGGSAEEKLTGLVQGDAAKDNK